MFLRNWARLYTFPTLPEISLERFVCKLGVPYRAQHPFFRLHRIVDFALTEDKVVIEVDGASHLVPKQKYKDLVSTIALEELGWKVVRFTNHEALTNPGGCVASIPLRLATRPTLVELREALRQLPDVTAPPAKKNARKPKQPRAKVRKRQPGA